MTTLRSHDPDQPRNHGHFGSGSSTPEPSGRWSVLRSLAVAVILVAAAMAAVIASAQTLYWDPNGTSTAPYSATGNWDGTTANWSSDPLGGAAGTFTATTSATNNLVFSVPGSTGSPTITVSGTQAANSLTFDFSGGTATGANGDEDNVSLTGGTITLGGGVNPGIFVSASPAGTATSGYVYSNFLNSAVTMASDLTFRNSSLTTFQVNGTVSGAAKNLVLQNNSNNHFGLVLGSVGITGASAITNNGTGRGMTQISGVISGTTILVQDSATSALWLNGSNTSTGVTTLKQGLVILPNVAALANTSSIQFQGGILGYRQGGGTPSDLSGKFTSNGADYKIDLPTAGLMIGSSLAKSGNAGLHKYGQAQLTLTGDNLYTGKTTIGGIDVANMQLAGGGTLTVGNTAAGSLNGDVGTDLDFQGTGVFEVQRAPFSDQHMKQTTFSAGDGTVKSTQNMLATLTLAAVSRTVGATGNFTLNEGGGTPGSMGTNNIVISGRAAGALGPGYFFGGDGYAFYDVAGFVRALNYSVDASAANAAASGAAVSLPSKTYQQVLGSVSAQADGTSFTGLNIRNTGTGNQSFTLAAGATVTANSVLVSGGTGGGSVVTISGGTAFRPQSNGELIVRTDGGNDRLVITNLAANGVNPLTKSGAGTLVLSGTNTLGGNGITGNVAINQGSLIVASATNATYSGVFAGQGGLNVAGAGTLTLNGSAPMTYTGGTVINGTLVADFSNLADPTNMLFTGMPGSKGTGVGSGYIALGGATGNFLRGPQTNGTLIIKGKPGADASSYQQLGASGFAGSGGNVTVQNGLGRVLADPNGGRDTTVVLGFPGVSQGGVLVIGKAAGAGSGNVFFQAETNSSLAATGAYGGNWGKLFYTNDGAVSDLDLVVALHYRNTSDPCSLFPAGTNGVNYTSLTDTSSGTYNLLTGDYLATRPNQTVTTNAEGGVGIKLKDVRDGQRLVFGGGGNTGFGTAGLIMTGSGSGNFTISGGTVDPNWRASATRFAIFQMNPNMTLTIANCLAYSNDNNGADQSINKNGLGTVVLSGQNTMGVTGGKIYINEGMLVAGSPETLSSSGVPVSGPFGVNTAPGAIRFSGGTLGYSAANIGSNGQTYDYSNRFSTAGMEPIRVDTGGQSVTFASVLTGVETTFTKLGAGTLTLGGTNTYTGTTTFAGGNLRAGVAETAGTRGPFGTKTSVGALVFAGGTLQYSTANAYDYSGRFSTAAGQPVKIDTNGRDVTFATALNSSGGTLSKYGSGTLTLSAVNTYSGTTTVAGGTLALDYTGSIANSPTILVGAAGTFDVMGRGYDGLTLAANQEIKGDGIVNGNVTLGDGSVISPGTDVGVLSFDGNLILSPTTVFNFQLGSPDYPGTSYDQLRMLVTNFGFLDLGMGIINFSNFNFTALSGFSEGTYTLFDCPFGTSGWLGSSLEGSIANHPAMLEFSGASVMLTVAAAVPEPGTIALLSVAGLAAAATVLRRRRR